MRPGATAPSTSQASDNRPQASDNRPPCGLGAASLTLARLNSPDPVPNRPPPPAVAPVLSPLNRVRAGCVVIIKQLTADADVNRRLREMGFGEEQRVKVITLQNNVLCQVCNARLGLSAKLAEKIMVEPVAPFRLAA